jgi:hypothetical protein
MHGFFGNVFYKFGFVVFIFIFSKIEMAASNTVWL